MKTLRNFKETRNQVITILLISILSLVFIFKGASICKFESNSLIQDTYRAKVTKVLDSENVTDELGEIREKYVFFEMYIQSGYMKGETITGVQMMDYIYAVQPKEIEKGDKIIVSTDIDDNGKIIWLFVEYNRLGVLIMLGLIFFGIILYLGRTKGIGTILSLIYTTMAIFMMYIPGITKGMNIYALTTVISIFIILMSLTLINGFSKKTLCAILGNLGGVFLSALITFICSKILHLTGLVQQDYVFLTFLDTPIDLKALVWGGIVIGALGAIMDVAMTIASSMNELSEKMRSKSFKNMFVSGMNIGKDAIGTMTNTLVLAYVGSSLAVIILIFANNKGNLLYIMNMEMIVTEILQALAGSLGILLCVPVTVFISAYLFNITPKLKAKKTAKKEEIVAVIDSEEPSENTKEDIPQVIIKNKNSIK